MAEKQPNMSREQARELYDDMRAAMDQILKNNPDGAPPPKKSKAQAAATNAKATAAQAKAIAEAIQGKTKPQSPPMAAARPVGQMRNSMRPSSGSFAIRTGSSSGKQLATIAVIALAATKIVFSGLEASGVASVDYVQASTMTPMRKPGTPMNFSREEVEVLTTLDSRRAELEDRSKKLDDRDAEIGMKDREFAARLAQLRELTGKLKVDREKDDKKREDQIAQLANVYGSMNPPEAASLIEQLDVTTALELLKKMPEKRIGQILSLMNSERALTITKMLSGKIG